MGEGEKDKRRSDLPNLTIKGPFLCHFHPESSCGERGKQYVQEKQTT